MSEKQYNDNSEESNPEANEALKDFEDFISGKLERDREEQQRSNPGYADAEAFLCALDPNTSTHTFQTYDDNKARDDKRLALTITGTLSSVWDQLKALNAKGAGVSVTVNKTDGKGRGKENITHIRGIWCESDTVDDRPIEEIISDFPIPPTLIVNTSPRKYHFYWLLDKPWKAVEHNITIWQDIMQGMVQSYNSCNGAKDLPRALRMPGFDHRKGEPRPVGLTEANGSRYSIDEITEAFPPIEREEYGSDGDQKEYKFNPELVKSALEYIPNGERTKWFNVGKALVLATGGSEEAKAVWKEWARRRKLPDDYMDEEGNPQPVSERELENYWNKDLRENRYPRPWTLGSLFDEAKRLGWKPPKPKSEHVLIDLTTIEIKPIDWLCEGWIAIGKLNALYGHPGQAKSFFTCYVSAMVTTGGTFPDGSKCPEGSVLMYNAEDGVGDTIKRRLVAEGADLSRIRVVQEATYYYNGKWLVRDVDLTKDVSKIENAIIKMLELTGIPVKLVIIDPISMYLGKINFWKSSEMRSLLSPLKKLAEKYNLAILLVDHLNKDIKQDAITRGQGVGITGAVRVATLMHKVEKDPDNGEKDTHYIVEMKNNLTRSKGGRRFTIDDTKFPFLPRIVWVPGTVDYNARKALTPPDERRNKPPSVSERIKTWLIDILTAAGDEGLFKKEVISRGVDMLFKERTIEEVAYKLPVARVGEDHIGVKWVYKNTATPI